MILLLSELAFVGVAFLTCDVTATSLVYGGAVVLVGCVLSLWAAGYVPPAEQTTFKIHGPWRFLRHPDVLARFLMIFGALLIARTPWLFAAAMLVLGWNYQHLVREGDVILRQVMGPSFAQYRMFVPSFVPQFMSVRLPSTGLRSPQVQTWSLRRIVRHGATSKIAINSAIIGCCVVLWLWLESGFSVWWPRAGAGILLAVVLFFAALEVRNSPGFLRRIVRR